MGVTIGGVLTDEEKVAEYVRTGDAELMGQVFEKWWPSLWRRAAAYAPRKEDIEDILQDAAVTACRYAKSFDPTKPIVPWLHAVIRTTAIRKHEVRQRRIKTVQPDAGFIDPRETDEQDGPFEQAAFTEMRELVRANLAQLSPKQREAIDLIFFKGMTRGEARRAIGISWTSMNWRMLAALEGLRKTGNWPTECQRGYS